MMRIPYSDILKTNFDMEYYMSNPSNNKIIRWLHKWYWDRTSKNIVKLLNKSKKYTNGITRDDIVLFAQFALATDMHSDTIHVARYDSRYIVEFNQDDHTYTVDTHGTTSVSFYLIEKYQGKEMRSENTTITTEFKPGYVIYNAILEFITEYLQLEENNNDN